MVASILPADHPPDPGNGVNRSKFKFFRTWSFRAYPGSEFVVAKWKKLEPNEINFSQGFSQKVSTSCFVFYSVPAMSADNLCKQFGPRSGPTKCRA